MFRNFIFITLRNLWKNKTFSFINISGLMLGLTCAMLIILYTKDELSYDRFHKNNPNIFRIVNIWRDKDGGIKSWDGSTGYFQGPKFKEKIPEIQAYVQLKSNQKDIRQGTEITNYEMLEVDSNFFSLFSFPLLSGNPVICLDDPHSIVISEDMARKFFNSTNVLGKTIDLKNNEQFDPYVISGVSKNCPQNSSIKFDFLLPMVVDPAEFQNNENWFNFFQNTFVLLVPGASVETVVNKMRQVYEADARETIVSMTAKYNIQELANYSLQPYTDIHLNTNYHAGNGLTDGSKPTYSYILTGIAIFILLIACINFINLTVARSLKRAKEIGVRKVVGSGRGQLMGQFLGESFLICLVAFGLAILLTMIVMPTFNKLASKSLAFEYLLDAKLVALYLITFVLTGLLAGFYPAMVMSGYRPVETLYGRFKISGRFLLQKSLVILQFSLASFLIISTMVVYSQFNYLIHKDLGYDDKNVVVVESWGMARNQALLFKQQLLKSTHIESVALKNGGQWGTIAQVNGNTQLDFTYETVDEDYLPLFKLTLLSGRNFSREFPSDSTHSVLVNESFVQKAGWDKPLGQIVNFWYRDNEKYTVIGVVKDYHFNSLNEKIRPQLFTMKPSNPYGKAIIKIKPASESASLQYISATYKSVFPINAYIYKFMDQQNKLRYASEAKWKQIILYGAILTIFISCIGLFGLANLSTEKRTKEIGIRKVLGASSGHIVRLLSSDFIRLVCISFIFSFPVAYLAAQKWLVNYPYRAGFSFWIFILTAVLTACIALATVGWDALRASMMNPVKNLRSE